MSKFKIGDKVRVVRVDEGSIPSLRWWPGMFAAARLKYVGTVNAVLEDRVQIVDIGDASHYYFPLNCVENLSQQKEKSEMKYPELQYYQRVVTRGQGTWIVLPPAPGAKRTYPEMNKMLARVFNGGISGFNDAADFDHDATSRDYDVTAVYESPEFHGDVLHPERMGKLIWSRAADAAKANAVKQRKEALAKNVAKLKARIAEMEKEIAE